MPRVEAKPDPAKQLMIKTKACQRLIKECTFYEREVAENEKKLQQMKDENRDPYDIKKFQEVLSESHMMIPDSICRRDKALSDLKDFLAVLEGEELAGNEWMVEAKNMLSGADLSDDKAGKETGIDVAETPVEGLADGEAF